MIDEELTLSSTITQEEFNMLTDAELDHTNRIWFETPKGKKVEFVALSVIEDIKAEIKGQRINRDKPYIEETWWNSALQKCVEIIDKHISGKEQEVSDADSD